MSLRSIVLIAAISTGGAIGWYCDSFGGIMGSYLTGILGTSIGLFLGRKVQRKNQVSKFNPRSVYFGDNLAETGTFNWERLGRSLFIKT